MKLIDLTGQTFGNLTVLCRSPDDSTKHPKWVCSCICGTSTAVMGIHLRSGRIKSCGCWRRKHGWSKTPEYNAWSEMKQRCLNPQNHAFQNYGGRGIGVCDRWINSVENFIADMGPRPSSSHTLERRDVNGNYEPNNCYWATWAAQSNNKRVSLSFTHGGRTMTLKEWSNELGIGYTTLHYRLERGMSFEEAISTEVRPWKRQT